jgi:NADPH-dependent 2,4-dienoyl-CoA reductase/sulfur reductase-like enzyme/Fe-S-cluster-containing hydrogenase component 2
MLYWSNFMKENRITRHPILKKISGKRVSFKFNGEIYSAFDGEMISSALFAVGITTFGHHSHDNSPLGLFCANGQCSQCMVIVDGKPMKGCMTPVSEDIDVRSAEGLPQLEESDEESDLLAFPAIEEVKVLIVGGGPAGLNGAIELGKLGIEVLIVDDKAEAGGKLSLQTHNFFGSVKDCYAGTRGVDIGHILTNDAQSYPSVKLWLNSTVVGVYSDKVFGILSNGVYKLVKPEAVLIATGAREKSLVFPGCELPGVYGAGAFQTLVNRDLIRCSENLFIIGGGNVGVIAAYHALQAGIDVAGLVEALPKCGGYKVHVDKIKRLGVPIWTSKTILRAEGDGKVERAIIASIDSNFQPIAGTEEVVKTDTILVAVGLSPVNELLEKSKLYGINTYMAGDAEEIAEASAAIFSGKIVGRKMARDLGYDIEIPADWQPLADILKSRPGSTIEKRPRSFHSKASFSLFGQNIFRQDYNTGSIKGKKVNDAVGISISPPNSWESTSEALENRGESLLNYKSSTSEPAIFPVLHCYQEIPCNPCVHACPLDSITIDGSIMNLPEFEGKCIGCERCILACPGLAISLIYNDYDPTGKTVKLALPFEFEISQLEGASSVVITGVQGDILGDAKIIEIKDSPKQDRRKLIYLQVPSELKLHVVGFQIRKPQEALTLDNYEDQDGDPIVCLCERIRKSEIVGQIRAGVTDMNQLKATIRTGMGSCGGKTCTNHILRIFREEGVDLSEVVLPTDRPFVTEVHLGDFLVNGNTKGEE